MKDSSMSDLARYQSALLALLVRDDLDLDGRLAHLREDPVFAAYAAHVAGFEPRFVEQCTVIAKRWVRRTRGARPQKAR
jgi:hypothetical protein